MATRKFDRIAPPLMHAFRAAHDKRDAKVKLDIRDKSGERVIAARRPQSRAPITEAALRREVAADLVNLLNTTNLNSADELGPNSAVASSILNFGFPDLSWRTLQDNGVAEIARELETALADFEPRLDRDSIKVRRDEAAEAGELKLRFLVRADLRLDPLNAPIEFAAEVELNSGKIKLDRL